jgi:hypothetical protein
VSSSATGASWSTCTPTRRLRSMRCWPKKGWQCR